MVRRGSAKPLFIGSIPIWGSLYMNQLELPFQSKSRNYNKVTNQFFNNKEKEWKFHCEEIFKYHNYLINSGNSKRHANHRCNQVYNFLSWATKIIKKDFKNILYDVTEEYQDAHSRHLINKGLNRLTSYQYKTFFNRFLSYCMEHDLLNKKDFNFFSPEDNDNSVLLSQELGCVYKITNNIQYDPLHPLYNKLNTWDKCYIGKSSRPFDIRYQDGIENTHNKYLKKSIEEFGLENFSTEIIEDSVRLLDLNRVEHKWVKENDCLYPKGYNIIPPSVLDCKISKSKDYWIRNIKTNKVFKVKNLLKFCSNPKLFDESLQEEVKINYQALSNSISGYISPKNKELGLHFPSKIVVGGTYCPARYSLKDIENFSKFMYKKRCVDFFEKNINKSVELINAKTLEITEITTKESFVKYCLDSNFNLSHLKRVFEKGKLQSCGHLIMTSEYFKKSFDWLIYDEKGNYCNFTIIHKESKKKISFTWDKLATLAEALYESSSRSETLKKLCKVKRKELAHSTFGRSIRRLLIGEIKTAYGFSLSEDSIPMKIRIMHFLKDKRIKQLKKEGFEVIFRHKDFDSKKSRDQAKKIFTILGMESQYYSA